MRQNNFQRDLGYIMSRKLYFICNATFLLVFQFYFLFCYLTTNSVFSLQLFFFCDWIPNEVRNPVRGLVCDLVCGPVCGPVRGLVCGPVRSLVCGPVHGPVHGPVRGPVHGPVLGLVQVLSTSSAKPIYIIFTFQLI